MASVRGVEVIGVCIGFNLRQNDAKIASLPNMAKIDGDSTCPRVDKRNFTRQKSINISKLQVGSSFRRPAEGLNI